MEVSAKAKPAIADELVRKMLASGFSPEVIMDMLDNDVIVRNRNLFVQFGFDQDKMEETCLVHAEAEKRKRASRRLAWAALFFSAFLSGASITLCCEVTVALAGSKAIGLALLICFASLVSTLITFGAAVHVAVVTTN